MSLTIRSVDKVYEAEVLADSPVAYYRLADLGTTAVDRMGLYSGTIVGSPIPVRGVIAGNGALSFDGVKYVSIPDSPALRLYSGTYELWINLSTAATGNYGVIGKVNPSSSTSGPMIYVSQSGIAATRKNASNPEAVVLSAPYAFLNKWTHVAFAFNDGGRCDLYINGVSVANSTALGFSTPSTSEVRIAKMVDGFWSNFVGSIDEVAIYQTALSPARILAHYNAGRPQFPGVRIGNRPI